MRDAARLARREWLAARSRLARRRLADADRRRRRWTRSPATSRVALLAHDSHSLWLNSAALARGRTASSRSRAAWSSATRRASRPASCARRRAGTSATATSRSPTTSTSRRCARVCGSQRREASRPCTTRTAGSARFVSGSRLAAEGALTLRVWQSLPADELDRLAGLGLRSGFGNGMLRVGYLKAFMDGTLGSQTARMLDGTGVEITSRDELAEIVRRAAPAGWPVAVHAIGDLANREALDAFEETRDEWAAARPPAADRARAAAGAGGRRPLRRARRRRLRPVQPRAVGPRRGRPVLGRQDGRRLRLPLAVGDGRGGRQRLGRADRGARPAGRHPRRCPSHARRPARRGTPSRR